MQILVGSIFFALLRCSDSLKQIARPRSAPCLIISLTSKQPLVLRRSLIQRERSMSETSVWIALNMDRKCLGIIMLSLPWLAEDALCLTPAHWPLTISTIASSVLASAFMITLFMICDAASSFSVMAVLLLFNDLNVFLRHSHFALLFVASISLRVASSRRAVSTAPDGKWT